MKGSTASEQTVGLLGPLLSNDRLNNATAHSPLTLSCRGETALCQRLGIPLFKQLPTKPLEHTRQACHRHGMGIVSTICTQRGKKRAGKRVKAKTLQ